MINNTVGYGNLIFEKYLKQLCCSIFWNNDGSVQYVNEPMVLNLFNEWTNITFIATQEEISYNNYPLPLAYS